MQKRVITQIGVIAAAMAVGFLFARATHAGTSTKGRVFELRTYTANEGKLDALNARFRNHTTRLFEKHGIKNIGYWVPQEPPLSQNTLIYIVAHESREAAKKSWQAFRNDPEWKKAQQASEAEGRLAAKIESVFLDPMDYSPLQ